MSILVNFLVDNARRGQIYTKEMMILIDTVKRKKNSLCVTTSRAISLIDRVSGGLEIQIYIESANETCNSA